MTSYVTVEELWNSEEKAFNGKNLQQLFGFISGKYSPDISDITEYAQTPKTSADFRAVSYKKEKNKDIVVRLGGLDFTPTYLSTDKSGNAILTLWLTNNEQAAWQTDENIHKSDAGDYYGFALGPQTNKYGLYSDWSADWYSASTKDGTAEFYPSAMYGTSYIRSVTLNNGGQYATSNTVLAEDPGQDANNVFAKFTMPSVEGNLTEFLVKPSQVSWQENQSAKETAGASYKNANDELNPADDTGYYSAAYNYAEHNGYDAWANDYIWLPSLAEMGRSETSGLWKASIQQRQNHNGSVSSFSVDRIGTTQNKNYATTALTYSGLRSANSGNAGYVPFLFPSGDSYGNTDVYRSLAVRPALHLNLNSAAAAAKDMGSSVTVESWITHAAENFSGGSGETAADAILINSAEELALLAKNVKNGESYTGKYFKQTANINLGGYEWEPIGNVSLPFSGIFDGNGYKIEGLATGLIKSSPEKCRALFGFTSSATLQNINLSRGIIRALDTYAAGVVGYASGGTITNCHSKMSVTGGPYIGGIVAYSTAIISDCTNSGNIEGKGANTGGIVGYADGGSIKNCSSSGNITGTDYVGGIAGYTKATLTNCANTGNVTATAGHAGGLAAYASARMTDCTNSGNVSGPQYIGGAVGQTSTTLTNCINTGTVKATSSYSGGLVGSASGAIIDSKSSGDVTGAQYTGGIIGNGNAALTRCVSTGNVTGTQYVGGTAGYNSSALASCTSSGNVTASGDYAGGVSGYANSSITSCASTGNVSANQYAGGVAGYSKGQINGSSNSGNVVSSTNYAGGVVGKMANAEITKSLNAGDVTGGQYVGGIAGSTNRGVTICATDGLIKGEFYVGSLVGSFESTSSSYILENNAAFGGIYLLHDPSFSGALVGRVTSASAVIKGCSFVGFSNFSDIAPFCGALEETSPSPQVVLTYVQINKLKIYTGEESGWDDYFDIVPALNGGLPLQKELFHLSGVASVSNEQLIALFQSLEFTTTA